jgi:hypothetical protein
MITVADAVTEEYKYRSPAEVLETILAQTADHNSEGYGEHLSRQRDSDLATTLRGLLRDETLAVFERGDYSLDS